MKKYRMFPKLKWSVWDDEKFVYVIKKRFLFFFWIELKDGFLSVEFKTKEQAKKALEELNNIK